MIVKPQIYEIQLCLQISRLFSNRIKIFEVEIILKINFVKKLIKDEMCNNGKNEDLMRQT